MLVIKGKKCVSNNVLTKPSKESDDLELEMNLPWSAAHMAVSRAQCSRMKEYFRLVKPDEENNLHFNHNNLLAKDS